MKNIYECTQGNLKDKNGITLIALIVTIIVILIISGVVILQLTENGLVGKAASARNKNDEAYQDELNAINDYISIIDGKGEKVGVVSSREETWNGATMLTITVSNITGGTFTINVNNVEANNYGKMYYYVNNKLVYSGTELKYTVTEIEGNPITDNTTYDVQVLAEPFKIKVTTGTGDNIDSWLACIGNTNEKGYNKDNLSELFADETLLNDLLNSDEAINYLLNSTEIIFPSLIQYANNNNQQIFDNICNNSTLFGKIIGKEENFKNLLNIQNFRKSMYKNYRVTQGLIANSSTAISAIKKSNAYTSKTASSFTRVSSESDAQDTILDANVFIISVYVKMSGGRAVIGEFTDGTTSYWIGKPSTDIDQTFNINKFMTKIKGAKYNCDNNPTMTYYYLPCN